MRIDKWKVALPIFVCASICLYAAKKPENIDFNVPLDFLNIDANVPPGVHKTDWHAITDDFGFILQITKEPTVKAYFKFKQMPAPWDLNGKEVLNTNESFVLYGVGRAQASFFARRANRWYMVTMPPPPVGFHLLQSVEP